jgi:hypothetical protein
VGGQVAVASAGQQVRAASDAPITVHRHCDLDVIQERRKPRGLFGEILRGRQVMRISLGMAHEIHGGARGVGGAFGDDVGHLLQPATVNGQEAEA